MTLQTVNTGTLPNDGTGDPLRTAFITLNNNMGILNNILYINAQFPNATIATLSSTDITVSDSMTVGNGLINSTSPTTGALKVTGGLGVLLDTNLGGSLTVGGNLVVNGTTTTVNTANLNITDVNITLANGALSSAAADGGGITLAGANATITYSSSDTRWNMNKNLNVSRVYGTATNVSTALTIGTYLTSSVGSTFDGSAATTIAVDATTAATGNKVVVRDPSGNFSAATITASLTGTATNATNVGITNDIATDADKYITWVDANSGNNPVKTSSSLLYFHPSTGKLTATSFAGTGAGTLTTGTGTVTLNGNITTASGVTFGQVGNGTFSTGTGNISLNGNIVTNITQSGAYSFTTGSGAVALNGNTTIGSGMTLTLDSDPTLAKHAVTKQYVDNNIVGLHVMTPARIATTGSNVALSGLQTIDGVTLVDNDRILVKDQTLSQYNGIYVAHAGAWARSTDANTWLKLVNSYVWVQYGSTLADTGWVPNIAEGGTIDTTSVPYAQFSAASTILGGAGLVKTGNTLDVVGTTNRITANADSIDIHASYVGQSSITTVGALTSGSIGAGFTSIDNARLTYSAITIGSTSTALGSTSTALAGLTGLTFATGAYNLDQASSTGYLYTGTGAVHLNGNTTVGTGKTLTLDSNPTLDMHAATKKYVDVVAQGLDAKASVVCATAGGLPSYSYYNGAGNDGIGATLSGTAPGILTIDTSVTPALNDRVLVKNEVGGSAAYNGIYTVTTVGTGGVAFVLTRASDLDTWVQLPGAFCWIEKGTTNGTTSWACTNTQTGTMGTTPITFSQFGGTNTLTGSSSITLGSNIAALTTVTNAGTASTLRYIDVDTQGRASNWATVTSLTFDGMTATSTSATPTLWNNVSTGSIAIGAGLTTGALNLAAVGTGATAIGIGHTNSTTTITGAVDLPTVGTSGFVKLGALGALSADTNTYIVTGGVAGSTTAAVTFTNTGGAAAGTTFNGSTARIIDYSTLGAAALAQTMYIGTTSVAINRTSAALALTGITSIDTAAGADTPTSWGTVSTGSITIGAGLTSGALNLATAGVGATAIGIGHTGSTTTITGTVNLPSVGTSGFVKLSAAGQLTQDPNTYIVSGGTAGAATTVTVTADNTATTYYPVFSATGAGSPLSLYNDPSTTPLSYVPSTSTLNATTFSGVATTAKYADLAEIYNSDKEYPAGTVMVFGGMNEVTVTTEFADPAVAGVVSTNPAYLMNKDAPGLPIALRGKVPIFVIGPVKKGDLLVASATQGCAESVGRDKTYGLSVFAKAIEDSFEAGVKLISGVIL